MPKYEIQYRASTIIEAADEQAALDVISAAITGINSINHGFEVKEFVETPEPEFVKPQTEDQGSEGATE